MILLLNYFYIFLNSKLVVYIDKDEVFYCTIELLFYVCYCSAFCSNAVDSFYDKLIPIKLDYLSVVWEVDYSIVTGLC